MKKLMVAATLGGLMMAGGLAQAADYQIDKQGQHASVNFKISHLGYSWIYGRFNDFDGTFSWDAAKPEASSVNVTPPASTPTTPSVTSISAASTSSMSKNTALPPLLPLPSR